MDINSIYENIGSFFSGGTIIGLITGIGAWHAAHKSAEAEAMEKVQGIYQKLTEDLVTEIDRLKTEVELLRQEVNILSRRAGVACYRRLCVSRICNEEDINDNQLAIERHEDNTEAPGRQLPQI